MHTYITDVEINGQLLALELAKTPGQEDYDRLRPLSYQNTHAILICFSIENPVSLDNVQEKVCLLPFPFDTKTVMHVLFRLPFSSPPAFEAFFLGSLHVGGD